MVSVDAVSPKPAGPARRAEFDEDKGTGTVELAVRTPSARHLDIRTLEAALREAQVDTDTWQVKRWIINSWEVTMSGETSSTGKDVTYTNLQVKVWLARKDPAVLTLQGLLADLKRASPRTPKLKRPPRAKTRPRRALEVSIFDPHLGLQCQPPGANNDWSIEQCNRMYLGLIERLLDSAKAYGPFDEVLFPFGNDLLHCDNVLHTTTQGTPQPEAVTWQHAYKRAVDLSIAAVNELKRVAHVTIKSVPGNHDRQSSFTMALLLEAYYHHDKNVTVDASPSPYKFWRYGVNLVGFEHGHSIRQTVRLAALMANETRLNGWKEARYCEWHLGDQHRKGSSKPHMFEEQGVSVEFLPGLTPPNEWARLKAFNWQKRAGMAFVWDHAAGPIARLQVNINNYTGEIMEPSR